MSSTGFDFATVGAQLVPAGSRRRFPPPVAGGAGGAGLSPRRPAFDAGTPDRWPAKHLGRVCEAVAKVPGIGSRQRIRWCVCAGPPFGENSRWST
jgi:hypothetical protein